MNEKTGVTIFTSAMKGKLQKWLKAELIKKVAESTRKWTTKK